MQLVGSPAPLDSGYGSRLQMFQFPADLMWIWSSRNADRPGLYHDSVTRPKSDILRYRADSSAADPVNDTPKQGASTPFIAAWSFARL